MTVTFARDQCAAHGSTFALATAHSDEELTLVPTAASGGTAWLAGERTSVAAPFYWTTDEPVVFDFQSWAAGEPDSDAASRYLAVSGSAFATVPGGGLASVCAQSIWPTW